MAEYTDEGAQVHTDTVDYTQYKDALANVYPYRAALDPTVKAPPQFMDVLNQNWQEDKQFRYVTRRNVFDWANSSIAYEFGVELPGKYVGFDPRKFGQWADKWFDNPMQTLQSMSLHHMMYYGMTSQVFSTLMGTSMHQYPMYFVLMFIQNVLTNIELAWGEQYAKYHPDPSEAYSFRYSRFYHPESGFGPLYPSRELGHVHLMNTLGEGDPYPYSFHVEKNNTTYLVFADYDIDELKPEDVVLAHLTRNT